MLLPLTLRAIAAAALLSLASCGTPPSPDNNDLHGTVRLETVQDYAYYPRTLVEEFSHLGLELKPTEGRVLETAVAARVRWDIGKVDPGCDIAIAVWHTAQWYNYAWAGDGDLMNATPNWWGLAQAAHPEIRDPLVLQNPTRLMDVFSTAEPVTTGRALTAWYVRGQLIPSDLNTVETYLIYGCSEHDRFTVTRVTAEVVSPS